MRLIALGAVSSGATMLALLIGSGAALAQQPADLQVNAGCGYPRNHVVTVRNHGPAPAYDVTVRYWSAFGPAGERHEAVIEPGRTITYDLGPMRTLELAAAAATSRTPDPAPGNNQGIFPTLHLGIHPMPCFLW
ncbi:hypothetical protein [Nocardia cyriacigeorgica]|uniref:hypothetical protein n=1 Tax=Nocardia cyriacigeorgica TaxID=135487 RepID=UPI0024562492|nr:hypothetical protein [Nocardia cyriacigeorgica]